MPTLSQQVVMMSDWCRAVRMTDGCHNEQQRTVDPKAYLFKHTKFNLKVGRNNSVTD